jgi:hypothetical protein
LCNRHHHCSILWGLESLMISFLLVCTTHTLFFFIR